MEITVPLGGGGVVAGAVPCHSGAANFPSAAHAEREREIERERAGDGASIGCVLSSRSDWRLPPVSCHVT